MNKAELVAAVAEKSNLTKAQAEMAMGAMFDTITEAMTTEGKILIQGFGGFSIKERAERQGRNPSTGAIMTIPKALVVNFKPATQLKQLINNQEK
ncbi:MAG TPA: HU family DNA-binding protein [Gammaproteobacteria bacterium]|nr:HU family DNA-binding protein [Gammaproteobacteria bacterium]